MRFLVALITLGLTSLAGAQTTLDAPHGEMRPYAIDTGERVNLAEGESVVFEQIIHVEHAAWIRLFFDHAQLAKGSFVRVTSLHDLETQELDIDGLAMWSYSTAFFNGDRVHLELVTGPGGGVNRLRIAQVMMEIGAAVPIGFCGICSDDRVLSEDEWSARLIPSGCTASVFNEDSCMVTAGHCVDDNNAVGFRIPPSNPDCSVSFPPIEEQFPIIEAQFENAGVGADWGVFRIGTNNLGQTPYERYGQLRPIAEEVTSLGETVSVWGYGTDSVCVENYVQQFASGDVTAVNSTWFNHDCDTTFGNSGSGMIRGGEIVGIATHCGCPFNTATRVDYGPFAAARDEMCDTTVPYDDCANAGLAISGDVPFTTVDATTDGFAETGCSGDLEHDVWFRFFAPCEGTLNVSLSSDYTARLAMYSGFGCPDGPDQAIACIEASGPGMISIPVGIGEGYRIRIGGDAEITGNGVLSLSCDEPLPCPGDCAEPSNGAVDVVDLLTMLGQWGTPGSCVITGENQIVDVNDLLALLGAYGVPCE